MLTQEAQPPAVGYPGGCATYPTWCEPPIKGNVSFNFCTPEEEAAGFRAPINERPFVLVRVGRVKAQPKPNGFWARLFGGGE